MTLEDQRKIPSPDSLAEPLISVVDSKACVKNEKKCRDSEDNDINFVSPKTKCLLRFLYFLSGISGTSWGRLSTIYYQTINLTTLQIGIIEGAMPVTKFFTSPLWGYIADKIRRRKFVWLFTRIVSSVLLMLFAIPQIPRTFSVTLGVSIAMSSFSASGGILNSFAIDALGKDSKDYGEIRMWMAVSWGLGSFLMGLITDRFHDNFTPNFIIYGVFAVVSVAVFGWCVPGQSNSETKIKSKDVKMNVFWDSICHAHVLFFLFKIMIFGIAVTFVERLLFIYLKQELDASNTLCGLCVGVTVIFELPIFYFGKRLLKSLGHHLLLTTSMVAYIIRVIGYTFLTPEYVWLVLACEILHGFTFACMWIASVDFANQIAPAEWKSTSQMVLYSVYCSLGAGIGGPVGGYIMQHYKGVFLYQIAGMSVFALLCLHVLGSSIAHLRLPKNVDTSKELQNVIKQSLNSRDSNSLAIALNRAIENGLDKDSEVAIQASMVLGKLDAIS